MGPRSIHKHQGERHNVTMVPMGPCRLTLRLTLGVIKPLNTLFTENHGTFYRKYCSLILICFIPLLYDGVTIYSIRDFVMVTVVAMLVTVGERSLHGAYSSFSVNRSRFLSELPELY